MNLLKHTLTLVAASMALAFAATPMYANDGSSADIPNPAQAYPELRPVFEAFGGKAGITALMDDFMVILLDDPRMRPFFENVDQQRVKDKLAEQVCVILGGDCEYTGMDMVEAHKGMEVRHADFNILVEDLQIAMDRRGIATRHQNKLLAKLAPMHREVINR
jgi:hemoglobin